MATNNIKGYLEVSVSECISTRQPFSMIGRIGMKESTKVHNDIFELFMVMTGVAKKLFISIKRNASYKDNIAHLPHEKTTYIDATNRSRHLTQLVKMGLIKKFPCSKGKATGKIISKQTFMINPDMIQPPGDHYEEAVKIWNMI